MDRLKLQQKLVDILGSSHVYFQPPTNIQLEYPCFVYFLNTGDAKFADDKVYMYKYLYTITFISKNSDEFLNRNLLKTIGENFRHWKFDRRYAQSNLIHDVFNVYF